MKITTILPVSRIKYLDRIIDCLMSQTVEIENLIVVFDGSDEEFIEVRNKIQELYIENRICVKSINRRKADTIAERRWHIVNIHNQIRALIGEADWVFSVEDDGILPDNALEELIKSAEAHEDVGMITGVELGRWGLPYVGAWRVDDIQNPKKITSLENRLTDDSGIQVEPIDGCGLYCALIRAEFYKEHTFDTRNGLGPDVNLGLYLRQQGLQNYINWNIPVTHLTERNGQEIEIPADSESKVVNMGLLSSNTWKKEKA
jgi:glycosyltransferase involved in cell wall biosynthesis